jgi:ABC-type multidrug transport system fused ATPase/permease subunit
MAAFGRLTTIYEQVRPVRYRLALGALLLLIGRLSSIVIPISTKYLIDDIIGRSNYRALLPFISIMLLMSLIHGLTTYSVARLLGKLGHEHVARIRREVQGHILRLPVAFYDKSRVGDLVSRVMHDVDGIRKLFETALLDVLATAFTVIIAFAVLFWINAPLAAVSLTFVAMYTVWLKRAYSRIEPYLREHNHLIACQSARLTEALLGIRVVKAYRAEQREELVLGGGVNRIASNGIRVANVAFGIGSVTGSCVGVMTSLMFYIGARDVALGKLSVGGLMTFVALLSFVVSPINQFASIGQLLSESFAAIERTRELLCEVPEKAGCRHIVESVPLRGDVNFENVSFRYASGNDVLRGVSFHAKPGTVTALVGPSGAGKSTIIGLIAGFYEPTAGRIWIDRQDLSTVCLDSYRKQLGIVLQDTFLFDGTIRENVLFARPSAKPEDVLHACRIARVQEFAEGFKDGYDTLVGERGIKLSGGQRQRVSIARAILVNAPILVLDEAMSSLDAESEHCVQEGLQYLMNDRTTFVIAHRLSTIRRADQILVLEDGRILEAGTHESLWASGSRYHSLHVRQTDKVCE